jgi:hypothetical protein
MKAFAACFLLGILSNLILAQTPGHSNYLAGYSRPVTTVVELELDDTVSPEFIKYHFYRFGYNIIDYKIRQVHGTIHENVSPDKLLLISQHPYVDEIQINSQPVDSSGAARSYTSIKFKHYASDEMINAFVAIHKGLDIELEPRSAKRVVVKSNTWRSDLFIDELKMLIYVESATLISPYIK